MIARSYGMRSSEFAENLGANTLMCVRALLRCVLCMIVVDTLAFWWCQGVDTLSFWWFTIMTRDRKEGLPTLTTVSQRRVAAAEARVKG